jgi:hypothetical protein
VANRHEVEQPALVLGKHHVDRVRTILGRLPSTMLRAGHGVAQRLAFAPALGLRTIRCFAGCVAATTLANSVQRFLRLVLHILAPVLSVCLFKIQKNLFTRAPDATGAKAGTAAPHRTSEKSVGLSKLIVLINVVRRASSW